MQALTAPLFKSIALGGVLLALTAVSATRHHPTKHRLRLHAIDRPHEFYLTKFRRGDVRASYAKNETIVWKTDALVFDGCHWRGIETLVPTSSREFAYAYEEEIISCEPGSTPTRKTPRKGTVTVED